MADDRAAGHAALSDAERETLYWRATLLLAAFSPFSIRAFARWAPSLNYDQTLFLVCLAACMPAVFAADVLAGLLAGRGLGRFWVRHPSVSLRHEAKGALVDVLAQVRARLERSGFGVVATVDQLSFEKAKALRIVAFVDHAFAGNVSARPTGFGTQLQVELTLRDTLLLDTGERDKLSHFADYIGLASETDSRRSVPLVTYCGLALAFVASVTAAGAESDPATISRWSTSSAAAAAGMLAYALYYSLRDRAHLRGGRLIGGGLYLAATPLLGWAIQLLGWQ